MRGRGLTSLAWALTACNPPLIDPTDVVVAPSADVRDADAAAGLEPGPGTCPVTFAVNAPVGARAVTVAGSWNRFSETATPLAHAPELGPEAFAATLFLPPGAHPLRLVVDGRVEAAPPPRETPAGGSGPEAVLTQWEDGIEYRSLRVADCAAPGLEVVDLRVTPPLGGSPLGGLAGTLCARRGDAPLAAATLTLAVGDQTPALTPVADPAGGTTRTCAAFAVEAPLGKHSLRAQVEDAAGRAGHLFVPVWIAATPFRWDAGLLYMAMVDRFADSDGRAATEPGVLPIANHLGGDFLGLRRHIEDGTFARLGVGALWLAPVQANATGPWPSREGHRLTAYHGYWPVDPRAVDPRLAEASAPSPEAALDALVTAAHARGLRIVVDVVLNHVHEDHPYCDTHDGFCRRTCVCGEAGCDWDARARDCQFSPWLPDLDHRDHAGLTALLDDVVAFVIDHDLDGLRVDAVKHLERAAVTNLRAHLADRARLDDRHAPLLVIGETFTGADGRPEIAETLGRGGLDGQFDFPLYWAIREAFARGGSFRGLEAAVAASEAAFGEARAAMSPFAGNHDVVRLATEVAGLDRGPFGGTPDPLAAGFSDVSSEQGALVDRLTLALAFTLTLPGVPLLYAGDELGVAGSGDPDNRRMRPATLTAAQRLLQGRVEALGQLRQTSPVLSQGARRELWIDDDLYVQLRWRSRPGSDDRGARAVLVVLNRGGPRTVALTFPPETGLDGVDFDGLGRDGRLAGRVAPFAGTGGRVEVRAGRASLTVGAGEVRLLGAL